MKVLNDSNKPKNVSGTRLEPGETAQVEDDSVLPKHVEEVEKSGDSDSDQASKSESEDSKGGEN